MIRNSIFHNSSTASRHWSTRALRCCLGFVLAVGLTSSFWFLMSKPAYAGDALLMTPRSSGRVLAGHFPSASRLPSTDGDNDLEPITARLQFSRTLYFDPQDMHSTFKIGMFRFDNQDTEPALSLQQDQAISSSTTWESADADTAQLAGLVPSLWIVEHGRVNGALSDSDQEFAAEQAAIWAFTDNFELTPAQLPDPIILERALELSKRARAAKSPDITTYIHEQGIQAFLANVSPTTVTVTVHLAGSNHIAFDEPYYFNIYINGQSKRIYTHQQTIIEMDKAGKLLEEDERVDAADNNTAIIEIPRNKVVMEIGFSWPLNIQPGTVFLPTAYGGPPIVTVSPVPVVFQANLVLDPSKYPSAGTMLNNQLLSFIAELNGWQAWMALVLLVWIVPMTAAKLLKVCWQLIHKWWIS